MSKSIVIPLERTAAGPALARRLTTQFLDGSAGDLDLAGDAELIVSELVTNAVLHGQAPIRLTLESDASILRIEVFDGDRRQLVQPPVPASARSGRGLQLVAALARRWGITIHRDGKSIWAELALPSGPSDRYS